MISLLFAALQSAAPVAPPAEWIDDYLDGSRALERGDVDVALERLRHGLTLFPGHAASGYQLACALARGGQVDEALNALSRAVDHGFVDDAVAAWDPDLASLREDERFQHLIDAMRRVPSPQAATRSELCWSTGGYVMAASPNLGVSAVGRGGSGVIYDVNADEVLAALERPGERTSWLDMSPDGKVLAVTGGTEQEGRSGPVNWLRIYDCATGDLLHELGDPGWQAHVEFSRDGGSLLVHPAAHGTETVYDTQTWTLPVRLDEPHEQALITPDGARLVMLRREDNEHTTLVFFDVVKKVVVRKHTGIDSIPNSCIDISSDSALALLVENVGHAVRVYDVRTGDEVHVFAHQEPQVTSACFLGTSDEIAMIDKDLLVRRFDARTGAARGEFQAEGEKGYREIGSSLDGTLLVLGGFAAPYSVYDLSSGRRLWSADSEDVLRILQLGFARDRKRLLASRTTGGPAILDAATGKKLSSLPSSGLDAVVAEDPTRSAVCQACSDGSIRRVDGTTGQTLSVWRPGRAAIERVCVSKDGARLVCIDRDHVLRVIRTETGQVEAEVPARGTRMGVVADCLFAPDGAALILLADKEPFRVLAAPEWKPRCTIDTGPRRWSVTWSPDGNEIAVAGEKGTALRFDARTGARRSPDLHVVGEVDMLAYAPDGKSLWVGSNQSKVHVFDCATWTEVRVLDLADLDAFDTVELGSATFRAAGDLVVTASSGFGVVAAWDPKSGERRWHFEYDGGNPSALLTRFTNDGKKLFVHGQGAWTPRIVSAEDGHTLLDLGGKGLGWIAPSADSRRIYATGTRGLESRDVEDGSLRWSRVEAPDDGWVLRAASGHLDGMRATLERMHLMLDTRSYPIDALAASLLDVKKVRAAAMGVQVRRAEVPPIPTLEWKEPHPRVMTQSKPDEMLKLGLHATCAGGVAGFEVQMMGRTMFLAGEPAGKDALEVSLNASAGGYGEDGLELRFRAISNRGVLSRALHMTIRTAK